jgi:hypothetical protein
MVKMRKILILLLIAILNMPRNSGKKQISPSKEGGNQNGSSAGTHVPAGGALVANFPPALVGGEDLARDDAAVNSPPAPEGEGNLLQCDAVENFPPAPAGEGNFPQDNASAKLHQHLAGEGGEPNFMGGDTKPPPEVSVKPDDLAVARLLRSLNSLKPLFSQLSASRTSRNPFKGIKQENRESDARFCVDASVGDIIRAFFDLLNIKIPKQKKSEKASFDRISAIFLKPSAGGGISKNDGTVPNVHVLGKNFDSILEFLFGSVPIEISRVFVLDKERKDGGISDSLILQVASFLRTPTMDRFIELFNGTERKATERYQKNWIVLRYLVKEYFSFGHKVWQTNCQLTQLDENPAETTDLLKFIYNQAHENTSKGFYDHWNKMRLHAAKSGIRLTEQDQFSEKMRFFFGIMLSQNQKCLFESLKSHEFLYDLAIELLKKLGRDTKRISFDDISSSHAAIVVLIFKELFRQFNELEEDAKFQEMLVQLFRAMTECFSSNNIFIIEDICFDDKNQLGQFRLELSAKSKGLSHNSLLGCDLSGFMLDPLNVWKTIVGRRGVFAWIANTGSGKSTLLLLLAILQAILSKANVFYIGPETATMNPEYVVTIIEVICQFFESCGRERPVIRLNQFGVAKCEAGVVNLFMTSVVDQCLPLLSVFQDTPSIVAVDDNTQLSPEQLKYLFSRFYVSQLHICGSTMNPPKCGNVVRIGEDVASSVSFCKPTFMDESGILSLSPDAYREFLIITKKLRLSWNKFFKECGNVSMGFISFFRSHAEKLQEFYEIVNAFSGVDLIRRVDLVKLARLLHRGFPAFQVKEVYSVKELNKITVLVREFITILNRIGYDFEDERLQFPKDLSENQRKDECCKVIHAAQKGESAQILLTTAINAYDLESRLVSLSETANMPILSSAKGLSNSPLDDKDPTGNEETISSSDDDDSNPLGNEEDSKKKKKAKNTKSKALSAKKPVKEQAKKPVVSIHDAIVENHNVQKDAADVAENASADVPADVSTGTNLFSADDAPPDVSTRTNCPSVDDVKASDVLKNLTLNQILKRIFHATELVGHSSLPKRKDVIEALSILSRCGHPESARWLKSFIYGVVLLDGIMPTEFIEICLKMFDEGRMTFILAYELSHLQSWNSKCRLMMKVIVADPVPLWHLLQTMARAGRLGTEHSGEISSWVSCLVLPNSNVSDSKSVSEEKMPLMIGNGEPVCQIECAIMAMLCRGNFSRKHHAFIVEFLRLFHFIYRNETCVHAFKGGRDYFTDFMKFISGVLISKFVSPFKCELRNLDDLLKQLAFTQFRHGIVDVEKTKDEFLKAVLDLVGPESASISLCLARATGTKIFIGISKYELPRLFTELYENYPHSFTSFLKIIRNLLMNLQQTQLCKGDSTVNATVSAMLLVITKTLEFVGDILRLLADMLRECDMEQFRVGVRPKLSPLEELHRLFRNKAGLPTIQDLRAFLRAHSDLKELEITLTNVCNFLNPNPSGPFYDMQQKCESLKNAICAKKNEKKTAELSKGKPEGMKPLQWVKHMSSDEFKTLCKQVDEVQLPQLSAEIRKLEDQLASIEIVLSNLPSDLSEVVRYFAKKI